MLVGGGFLEVRFASGCKYPPQVMFAEVRQKDQLTHVGQVGGYTSEWLQAIPNTSTAWSMLIPRGYGSTISRYS